jgi:cell division protein FtsL
MKWVLNAWTVGALVLALLASCMLLIRSNAESRRLYAALEKAKSEANKLQQEFKRLDAERQAQATHFRVERLATDKLAMRAATPAVTARVQSGSTAPQAAPAEGRP